MGFVVPEGWQLDPTSKLVLAVDPGRSGAYLVRRSETTTEKFDATNLVAQILATQDEPVVLSRVNGADHASIGTKRLYEGKPRWAQIVVHVWPLASGGDTAEVVLFETVDGEQYQHFTEQEVPEVFLASFHTPQSLPLNTFSGTWEGRQGRSAKALIAKGSAGEILDESWYFRLDLLAGHRYRLTRVTSSAAPLVGGWTATSEVGSFAVDGDAITLRRATCLAVRAPAGHPKKAGECGVPLGALVLTAKGDANSLILGGVHLFDGRFGMGHLMVSRPQS